MTISLPVYCFFAASSDTTGKTGLTVTVDVWRITKSSLATSEIVAAGSATEIGDGVYGYLITSADPVTYDYIPVFKTADTSVSAKHIPAVRWDGAEAHNTAFDNLDAAVSGVPANVWTSGTRTLTSLGSEAIDAIIQAIEDGINAILPLIPEAVWTWRSRGLTQTLAAIIASLTGNEIVLQRGDTITGTLVVGSIVNYTKVWLTFKTNKDDADTDSVIQLCSTGGLLYLEGATGTAADGTLTVDDADTGTITYLLKPSSSVSLTPRSKLYYDVQYSTTTTVTTKSEGTARIMSDITRAVS